MTAPNRRITPGRRLVRNLNKALADGFEWTEAELIALDVIEQAENRAAALREIFDAEVASTPVSTRRVTEVAAELRQLEAAISRLVAQLVPDPEAVAPAGPPSARHQAAARTRWDRRSHRPVEIKTPTGT